eukprot:jgi/Phyca11/125660/e_gw1.59.249.1
MRDGVTSSTHCKESGEVEYFQHLNQFTEPYSYNQTRGTWWKLAKLQHRQQDRQDFNGLGLLQRYVHQRFMEDSRTVFVWKTQSEGEGLFKGMKSEETGWVCLQPSMEDGSTLVRVCVRQAPLDAGSSDSIAGQFDKVLQSSVSEDMREISAALDRMLLDETLEGIKI